MEEPKNIDQEETVHDLDLEELRKSQVVIKSEEGDDSDSGDES